VLLLAGCLHMPGQLPSTCFHIAFNSVRFEFVTVVLMTVPFFLDVTLGEWFLML